MIDAIPYHTKECSNDHENGIPVRSIQRYKRNALGSQIVIGNERVIDGTIPNNSLDSVRQMGAPVRCIDDDFVIREPLPVLLPCRQPLQVMPNVSWPPGVAARVSRFGPDSPAGMSPEMEGHHGLIPGGCHSASARRVLRLAAGDLS